MRAKAVRLLFLYMKPRRTLTGAGFHRNKQEAVRCAGRDSAGGFVEWILRRLHPADSSEILYRIESGAQHAVLQELPWEEVADVLEELDDDAHDLYSLYVLGGGDMALAGGDPLSFSKQGPLVGILSWSRLAMY